MKIGYAKCVESERQGMPLSLNVYTFDIGSWNVFKDKMESTRTQAQKVRIYENIFETAHVRGIWRFYLPPFKFGVARRRSVRWWYFVEISPCCTPLKGRQAVRTFVKYVRSTPHRCSLQRPSTEAPEAHAWCTETLF